MFGLNRIRSAIAAVVGEQAARIVEGWGQLTREDRDDLLALFELCRGHAPRELCPGCGRWRGKTLPETFAAPKIGVPEAPPGLLLRWAATRTALPWDPISGLQIPGVGPLETTHLHVFAALVGATNKAHTVAGWGELPAVPFAYFPPGRGGMTTIEAAAYARYQGTVEGILFATASAERDAFFDAVKAEHARVCAAFQGATS